MHFQPSTNKAQARQMKHPDFPFSVRDTHVMLVASPRVWHAMADLLCLYMAVTGAIQVDSDADGRATHFVLTEWEDRQFAADGTHAGEDIVATIDT
jgi:hypothetical protein